MRSYRPIGRNSRKHKSFAQLYEPYRMTIKCIVIRHRFWRSLEDRSRSRSLDRGGRYLRSSQPIIRSETIDFGTSHEAMAALRDGVLK
jgi:hypothetical protein